MNNGQLLREFERKKKNLKLKKETLEVVSDKLIY